MIKSGKKLPEMIMGELNHEPFMYTAKQFRQWIVSLSINCIKSYA